jgi:cell cycle serine/threonine-protein kinase CDC5/MSD2
MKAMFSNCSKLTNLNLNYFNIENVNNMDLMFNNCPNLFNKFNLNKNITDNDNNITPISKYSSSLTNINFFNIKTYTIQVKKKIVKQYVTKNVIISNKNIKYTLFNIINKGSFGICYMAKDENNKFYAIKKINIQNKEVVKKEIEILKIMKSKYSVNFLESIEKDDNIYIVMELCDGDLNDLLENKNENLDIITIIKIINQLNEVLKLMHSKKIEHRDLKPENILIKYNYDYLFNYIIVGDMGKILIK